MNNSNYKLKNLYLFIQECYNLTSLSASNASYQTDIRVQAHLNIFPVKFHTSCTKPQW